MVVANYQNRNRLNHINRNKHATKYRILVI